MTTRTKEKRQTAFDETSLNDPQLETDLEAWLKAKATSDMAKRKTGDKAGVVRQALESKELPLGTYRQGRFVVTVKETESKPISFERGGGRQIRFRLEGEKEVTNSS